MIKLNEKDIILTKQEFNNNSLNIDKAFNINKNEKNNGYLFTIEFTNNIKEDNKLLIRLKQKVEKKKINGLVYNDYNLIGIINNSNDQIDKCIEAIFIKDRDERYEFIYDSICDELDELWRKNNLCDFKHDICVCERNSLKIPKKNGCCYSFWYTKSPFKVEGIHQCDFFDKEKHCTNRNISCKLFVCRYLRNKKNFQIKLKEIMLIQVFFNIYQKLIIKHNFFVSRKELIEKLKKDEKKIKPILLYYINIDFMIYKTTPKEKKNLAKKYDEIYKKTRRT